ncbi:MAG: protein kinase [Isosphaerales bacterium]
MEIRREKHALGPRECPSAQVLSRFSLGDLPDHVREQVEQHLEHCPACTTALDTLDVAGDELVAMLQSPAEEKSVPDFADPRLIDATAAPVAVKPSLAPDARFEVLRTHAQGGLGRVSEAHDRELNREVALKQIRPELADDPGSRNRFLLEAEITARLEHPGIIPVHGRGADERGRPYYAMRFVRGKTLQQAIDDFYRIDQRTAKSRHDRLLRLRQLLSRFIDVCNTVAYAHSRGVIHRDLKPKNILLGPYGETLIADWGLAKPTDRAPPGQPLDGTIEKQLTFDSSSTTDGTALGTPEYMSPEQAGGRDDVGPASDVYSLGATLYVLLGGQSPFHGCSSRTEVIRRVEEGAFPPASQVNPTVSPALAAVCLKAMALRPEERYPSAKALAEDVESWLAGEPVSAWKEPSLDRARRWLARRRTIVLGLRIASVVAIFSVAAFTGLLVWSNRELSTKNTQLEDANARRAALIRDLQSANHEVEQARDRAERDFDVALRAIEHFHRAVSLNLDVQNRPDLKPLRTELLQAPLEFYRVLKQNLQEHAESRPEASARFADAVAGLAQITGEIDSEPNAIRAYLDAIDVLNKLDRDHPKDAKYSFVLAQVLLSLGRLQLETNRVEDALVSNERARALYQRLAALHPTDPRYRFGLARVDNQLGLTKRTAHRPGEALASYQRALVLLEGLLRDYPTEDSYQSELAHVLRNLGVLERISNQREEAMRSYQQARAAFQTLVRRHPSVAAYRQGLANCYFNIGNLHIDAGRTKETMDSLVQARKVQEGLVHDHPTVGRFQADLARVHGQIGAFLSFQGRQDESLVNVEQARKILIGLVRDHPEVINYRVDMELTNYQIGSRQKFFGRYAQAMNSLEQARDFFDKMVRENPNDLSSMRVLAATWEDIAGVLSSMRRPSDAMAAYQQAILQQQRAYDLALSDPWSRQESADHLVSQHEGLAEIQLLLNRPTEAAVSLFRALGILKKLPNFPDTESFIEARICCHLFVLLGGKGQHLTAARRAQRGEVVGEALAAVRRMGSPRFMYLKQLEVERSFDSIRSTTEFQLLMLDLAFPANPFTR